MSVWVKNNFYLNTIWGTISLFKIVPQIAYKSLEVFPQ